MSRKIPIQWPYGVSAAGFLAFGSIQLFQGNAHSWIPIAGAVLVGAGLVPVVSKLDWGGLIAKWGLLTGVAWPLGLLGRDGSFPLGAWITGTGIATIVFFQDRGKTPAQPPGGDS